MSVGYQGKGGGEAAGGPGAGRTAERQPGKRTLTEALAPSRSTAGQGDGTPAAAELHGTPAAAELPHRAAMEQSFGRPLGHIEAFPGAGAELAPYGAQALATGNVVAFADPAPSAALVAHEIAHTVQNEQAGAAAPMASGVVGPSDSPAEAEADAAAAMVATHGAGVRLPPITAAPSAHVQLSPTVPTLRLDKSKEAQHLRSLISMRRQPQIVELLEQNANPEHMYALHRAYGSTLVADVQGALTEPAFMARARVYLGEQMPLDARIAGRDKGDAEAILGDLERIPDALALAMVSGDAVPVAWTQATWLPATTTLAAVRQALRSRLGADDEYRAMRLVLQKAERALAVQAAHAPAGRNLDGFTVQLEDLRLDPGHADAHGSPLALPPVSRARVDLAEARIRAADADGNWLAEPARGRAAALALTDLSLAERQALALRLRDRPLVNALGGVTLITQAVEHDDATVIRMAILDVQTLANLQVRASRGVGLEVALERAGALVHAARARLEQLPPTAPEAERARARAEVERLDAMFVREGSPVLGALRINAQRAGDADGGAAVLGAQLRALGADRETIATEELRAVPAGDAGALMAALRRIAPGDRMGAMQRAGLLDALASGSLRLAGEQRELIRALVWQGGAPLELGPGPASAARPAPADERPIVLPPGLGPPLFGPRPEVEIALHDILDAMDRGAADEVLGRLARMETDQRAIYADQRYQAKRAALPNGRDQSSAGHLKHSLGLAESLGAQRALLAYPTTNDDEHKVHVEAIGAQVDAAGPGAQASLRRAYVLVERLGGPAVVRSNPALVATLAPDDRRAVDQLLRPGGPLARRDHLDRDNDRETANQLIFGQPQLAAPLSADGKPGGSDPTTEADFMYFRLREAAGIRNGVALADWLDHEGPRADEAVAEFMTLYQRVHATGVTGGDLAQLAEHYHHALRHLDAYRSVTESLAGTAAQIVGATVATIVVTVASGGTLGPIAVGAMASLSAAASAAATGAALRVRSTVGTVLRDAGTGAVEGITAAAGAALAARLVRGAAIGVPAARAAASAGARAVGHAGADIAAAVIDGALGGAGGELFQTATDEATWDRGIAEVIAAMLAAIARGAGSGAAMGGAVGGAMKVAGKLRRLVARLGQPAAQDFARLAESVGIGAHVLEHLSDQAQEQIAHALELARAGKLDEAEHVLSSVAELSGYARSIAGGSATERVAPVEPAAGAPAAEREAGGRVHHAPGAKPPGGDARPRVTHERLADLEQRLKLRVVVDETGALHDGIELHYALEPHHTIRPTFVRVGPAALIDDVLLHGNLIERVTRYNGAIGKLRQLWDRVVALAKRTGKPLQPGTKAWESYQELTKLDELIALRQSVRMAHGTVEPSILDREIEFLEGYRAHHEAIVAEAERGGAHAKPAGHIDSPDWRRAVGRNDANTMHEIDPLGKEPHQQRLPKAKDIDPGLPPESANSGFWEDNNARGNTPWHSDNANVNEATGYKPVEFKHGYPVLDPYAQETVYLKQMVGSERDFAPANRELAKRMGQLKPDGTPNQSWAEEYVRQNRLTWHHNEDGVRMQLVPTDLHANIPHAGGASAAREAGSATRGTP